MYSIGDLVCANYANFNGEAHVGIFLIIYDEAEDRDVLGEYNVTCLKCSSQLTAASRYAVSIDMKKNPWMEKPGAILTSKVHTLDKVNNIYKKLGHLDKDTLMKVYKQNNKYVNETLRQVLEEL